MNIVYVEHHLTFLVCGDISKYCECEKYDEELREYDLELYTQLTEKSQHIKDRIRAPPFWKTKL